MARPPSDGPDVLVVGAGPTGLALALQAVAHGARVDVVDRRDGTPRPSRALVVHPRTLELLAPLGATERLLEAGSCRVGAVLHARGREVRVDLGGLPLPDTAYPWLLLVPQAAVETTLLGLLRERGVAVRWGAEVADVGPGDGDLRGRTVVRGGDGAVLGAARFVVGCDGAASAVRAAAGIGFPGRAYRHPVVVADVDLAQPAALAGAHVFAARDGILFLFPLGERAPWRLVVAGRTGAFRVDRHDAPGARHAPGPHPAPAPDQPSPVPPSTRQLADLVRAMTGGAVALGDVAWAEQVPLRHHLARVYRRGSVLLAGDAAHVHSPAGAQGMNTGLQDACALGWRLALAATSPPGVSSLLDGYERERRPVARLGIAWTSLAWWGESSADPVARVLRRVVVPAGAPTVARHLGAVAPGVRLVTGLALSHRRPGPPVTLRGSRPHGGRLLVGDRLPDQRLPPDSTHRLHELLDRPGHHLLLLGEGASAPPPTGLPDGWVHEVRVPAAAGGEDLARRLGTTCPAWCLVRPDRYVEAVGGG
ncbi:FAD-dependent monooxygenase [Pedococcus sp. NPDC057267]|uniref:FAD-dependent monooxygenase n=1 Tax=Pedococcus sp. NPDC057267 TaxID=3346077 RepID=UPI00362DB9F8